MKSSHSPEKKQGTALRVRLSPKPSSLLKKPAKRVKRLKRYMTSAQRVSTICPCCSDHKCTIHN